MCRRGNVVFVFGGTGFPFGQHVSNDLFLLDLKRRKWRRCQIQNQQLQRVYGAVRHFFFHFQTLFDRFFF